MRVRKRHNQQPLDSKDLTKLAILLDEAAFIQWFLYFIRYFDRKVSQKVTLPTLMTLLYFCCKNPWEFPRFPGYVDQQSLVKLTNHYPIHQWRLYLIAWFNWYLVTDYFRHEETEFVSTSHLYLSEWNFLKPIMW